MSSLAVVDEPQTCFVKADCEICEKHLPPNTVGKGCSSNPKVVIDKVLRTRFADYTNITAVFLDKKGNEVVIGPPLTSKFKFIGFDKRFIALEPPGQEIMLIYDYLGEEQALLTTFYMEKGAPCKRLIELLDALDTGSDEEETDADTEEEEKTTDSDSVESSNINARSSPRRHHLSPHQVEREKSDENLSIHPGSSTEDIVGDNVNESWEDLGVVAGATGATGEGDTGATGATGLRDINVHKSHLAGRVICFLIFIIMGIGFQQHAELIQQKGEENVATKLNQLKQKSVLELERTENARNAEAKALDRVALLMSDLKNRETEIGVIQIQLIDMEKKEKLAQKELEEKAILEQRQKRLEEESRLVFFLVILPSLLSSFAIAVILIKICDVSSSTDKKKITFLGKKC